jgi:hypothetical protein
MNKFSTVQIVDLIEQHSNHLGLCYLPELLHELDDLPVAHKSLINAAGAELIDLRPDAGLGRFKQWELDICPDGPDGSKLLWASLR